MPSKRIGTGIVFHARVALHRSLDTAQSAWRWRKIDFSDLPVVFGNAVPKGGSHLLLQVLQGLREAGHFASVEPEPIRTITQFERRWRPADEILADLKRLKRGRIGWGYVNATPENLALFGEPGRVNYFIYRDPRDVIVSSVYYARDRYAGHQLHDYYNRLGDFDACLRVEIAGLHEDGLNLQPLRTRFERYLGFFGASFIMPLRFEDLILRRSETIAAMLDYSQRKGFSLPVSMDEAVEIVSRAIQPGKSGTFRKGQPGDWREHFSQENKKLFKDVNGDLLLRLGYEKDNDW